MDFAVTLLVVCLLAGIIGAITWALEPTGWPTQRKTKGDE